MRMAKRKLPTEILSRFTDDGQRRKSNRIAERTARDTGGANRPIGYNGRRRAAA